MFTNFYKLFKKVLKLALDSELNMISKNSLTVILILFLNLLKSFSSIINQFNKNLSLLKFFEEVYIAAPKQNMFFSGYKSFIRSPR